MEDRRFAIEKRLESVLDEYCLSAIGRSVAMAYLRKLSEDDMSRARRWWLRKLNGTEMQAETPEWQKGSSEIIEGLRARPVWSVDECDWIRELEIDVIREEMLSLRSCREGFQPYRSPGGAATDSGSWNVFYLDLHNVDFAENRARCPRTCELMDAVPRKYGHAFFSATAPQTHITPHHGPTNKKLRLHIPLVCPANKCRLRVADQTIVLKEGVPVLFDDSFEHEAWNDSDEPRIVLVFDVWHPDLSDREIKFLSFLQTAAMRRDKLVCQRQGIEGDNFFAVIDRARSCTPDSKEIWGTSDIPLSR